MSFDYHSFYKKDSIVNFNVEWEITAYHPETNTFDIKAQRSQGYKISKYTDLSTSPYTVITDTTLVTPSTGMFQISVADNIISIPGSSYSTPLENLNIKWTPGSIDTLWIITSPGSKHFFKNYRFVKNVGLVYSGIGDINNYYGYGHWNTFTLKSYKLK